MLKDGDRLLDKHQVAEMLGIKPGTVDHAHWRQRVGLRGVKFGKSKRYLLSDIQKMVERGLEAMPVCE
jgi:hypothetical protein